MNMEEIERLRQQAIENTEGKEFDPERVILKFIDSDGNEQVIHDSMDLRNSLGTIPGKKRRVGLHSTGFVNPMRGKHVSVGHVIPGDSVPVQNVTRIERNGYYLRGAERNKPCPCGSGQKAKRCPCDKYEV